MRSKQSKTDKIRKLLDEGKSVKEIARRVECSPNYVYFVKWRDAKKDEQPEVKPRKNRNRDIEQALTLPMVEAIPSLSETIEVACEPMAANPLAVQVGGDHYRKLQIQPIEYITANNLGFLEGCIVKRISRWRDKDGVADLEKIKHEVDLLITAERSKSPQKNLFSV